MPGHLKTMKKVTFLTHLVQEIGAVSKEASVTRKASNTARGIFSIL